MRVTLKNKTSRDLTLNVIGSLIIRGVGIIISALTLPCYLRYIDNNIVLGVWFIILSVLTWVLTFDLGIGNGLRNHLTREISFNNKDKCRNLISSAYISLGCLSIFICICYSIASGFIDWNNTFNIDTSLISPQKLKLCIDISIYGVLISFFLRIATSILYAIQKAAITNLINVSSHLIVLLYLFFATPTGNSETDLTILAIVYAIATNIPLIIATIYIFQYTILKDCKPSFKQFNKRSAKAVISLGFVFLYIQILYMLITTTNEWFIGYFYSPEHNTEYQVYIKVFSLFGSLFMVAITPIWSAISKAAAENRYQWIRKMTIILYILVGILTIIQLMIIPILPNITKVWLGEGAIDLNFDYAIWFVLYSIIFTWIAVQSTIASGLGKLKVQTLCYTIAVICKILLIICTHKYIDNWVMVIVITSIALLPFCIIQPIVSHRHINNAIKQNI